MFPEVLNHQQFVALRPHSPKRVVSSGLALRRMAASAWELMVALAADGESDSMCDRRRRTGSITGFLFFLLRLDGRVIPQRRTEASREAVSRTRAPSKRAPLERSGEA